MQAKAILQLAMGFVGLAFFGGVLFEIRSVTLRRGPAERPVIFGWALFIFFIVQIWGVYDNMKVLPQWAVVVALVGIGFGASAAMLVTRMRRPTQEAA